jgi:ribosome-associated protein
MKRTASAPRKIVDKSLPLLRLIVRSLDDKKAEDLRVLDVRAKSSITDYLVLATGTSEPHLRALRIELEKVLDSAGARIVGVESRPGSGWTVFDAFDIMVHLFTAENRARYRLDLLWRDASDIPVARLQEERAVRRRKSVAPKSRKEAL